MVAGIPIPDEVEAETWWKCILAWRLSFRNGAVADDALSEYQNVVAAIELIAPHERVECVLSNDLWDRRRLILSRPLESGFLIA